MEVAELHIASVDAASGNHGQIAVIPAIGTDHALDVVRQGRCHRMNHWCFLPCANPDARPVRLAALLAMVEDIAATGNTPGNN